jgi:DNA-binding IclR family transcriptional regulator
MVVPFDMGARQAVGMSGKSGGAGARAVRLLQCVAEMDQEFTVTALAKRLELAPSTVHRLLQSVLGTGMIERSGTDAYRPGRELFRMASLLVQRFDIRAIARPILRALWTDWQETCSLCLYESVGCTAKVVDTIASVHPLQYVIEPATTLSLAWGSLGRSILAHLPDEDVEVVLARSKRGPLSGRKAPSRADLLAELRRIRRHGYARYEDRAVLNIAGIAAPVFSGSGAVLGSIGVTMPATRFKSYDSARLADAVVTAAAQVSSALGGGVGAPVKSSAAR